MAYEYHIATPTLNELDETKPSSSEDMSLYDEAVRQTRAILKTVFMVEHNADGTHKWNADSLAPNSITGDKVQSDASDDSKRAIGTNHIRDLNVTTGKLADLAVTTGKLNDLAVTNAKIATGVDAAKLSNLSLLTAAIADKAVTDAKLANDASDNTKRAVGTDHIKDAAIIARHIGEKVLTGSNMSVAQNRLLVGGRDGVALEALAGGSVQMVVDETQSPPVAKFTVNLEGESIQLPYAEIKELAPTYPAGGGETFADTWNTRPSQSAGSRTWVVKDKFDVLDIEGNKRIRINQTGLFLVIGWAAAYKVGMHQVRIYRESPDPMTLKVGSVAESASGASAQSLSHIKGILALTAGDLLTFQHWTELAYSTNYQGLGRGFTSVANTENQILASLLFIKVG